MKLVYIGKQEFPGYHPIRLWNIIDETSEYHQSTRSIEGLIELGLIPAVTSNDGKEIVQ